MAIHRGVSSYSYQNLIFDHKMDHRDFIRTAREDLDTDGLENCIESFVEHRVPVVDEIMLAQQKTVTHVTHVTGDLSCPLAVRFMDDPAAAHLP